MHKALLTILFTLLVLNSYCKSVQLKGQNVMSNQKNTSLFFPHLYGMFETVQFVILLQSLPIFLSKMDNLGFSGTRGSINGSNGGHPSSIVDLSEFLNNNALQIAQVRIF